MTLLLVGLGVLLLMLPGAVATRLARPRPRPCARLYAASMVLGLAGVLTGLVLHAAPVLVALAHPEELSTADNIIAHLSPGGVPAAVTSSLLVGVLGYRLLRGFLRLHRGRRRSRATAGLGTHLRWADHHLVVLPVPMPVAYSIGGSPSQVVVSEDLVARLSPEELGALLRHEQAHLHNGHQRYLAVAALVEQAVGVVPLVGRGARSLRMTIERWADEAATGNDMDRRAIMRRALLRAAPQRGSDGAEALADGLAQRTQALNWRPVSQRAQLESAALAVALILILLGTVTLGHWLSDVPALLAYLAA